MKERVILSWSGGKDSALALHVLQQENSFEVVSLITTMTEEYDRVSIHGVRRDIIEAQAASIGIPVTFVEIRAQATNEEYEDRFCRTLQSFLALGITKVAYGDIFLESLRTHRETMLRAIGMEGLFPLWKQNTALLADQFIREGFHAYVACVDGEVMDTTHAGRNFDKKFVESLPSSVDPCGERGEFHSCVYAGPIFRTDVHVAARSVVKRGQFMFADLCLA